MKKLSKLLLVISLIIPCLFLNAQNTNAEEPTNTDINISQRASTKGWTYNEFRTEYGVPQYRVDALCPKPAKFSWYDNGIPKVAVAQVKNGKIYLDGYVIQDTGTVVVDSGLKFRKFKVVSGVYGTLYFWANVNSKSELIYGK